MPRKQRFKPSRKPQAVQPSVATPQVDDRNEVHPDDVEIEHEAPAREGTREIEHERSR
jgi:hypothetical protein